MSERDFHLSPPAARLRWEIRVPFILLTEADVFRQL